MLKVLVNIFSILFLFSCYVNSRAFCIERVPDDSSEFVVIIAAGDLMMGGSALPIIDKRGVDYPFDSTRNYILNADFAVANLEAPFTQGGTYFEKKKYRFKVPTDYADVVLRAGFDVLTLANNHILDYGYEGLYSTLNVLKRLNISSCGAGRDLESAEEGVVVQKGCWRVGFLAYSLTYPSDFWASSKKCGTAFPMNKRLRARIERMKREEADIVVVSFHWGGELMDRPKGYQRYWAHKAVEYGADLVIGHHPHVVQGFEIYNNRLIAYSLGNYVFGSYSKNVDFGMLLKVRFGYNTLSCHLIPIYVNNYKVNFQPRSVYGRGRKRIIDYLNEISMELNSGIRIINESGIIDLEMRDEP